MMFKHIRFNVFGTRFSCVDKHKVFNKLYEDRINHRGYLSFPDTSLVANAYKNKKLRNILNNSLITFTDGKITEFYAKLKGEFQVKNISGFDLLEHLLNSERTHFFYGLNNTQIKKLREGINKDHPKAKVLGYKSPPFVSLNEIENNVQIKQDIEKINKLKPDFIWVGISSPKQDYLMSHYVKQLDQGIMVGVGAVLLYKAGILKKGPQWIKNIGMRWFVRFIQEPIRVWKKGSITNILTFLYFIIKHDICRIKMH